MNFTIVHWLITLVFITLFILVLVLIKDQNKNTQLIAGGISALLLTLFGTGTIYGIDSFLKVAELSPISTTRYFNQEKIIFSGTVTNSGKFNIATCSLKITMHNSVDTASLADLKEGLSESFGGESTFMDGIKKFFGSTTIHKDRIEPKTVHEEIIANDLRMRDVQNFSVELPLQSGVSVSQTEYELTCH
jgi:hypothetical protein